MKSSYETVCESTTGLMKAAYDSGDSLEIRLKKYRETVESHGWTMWEYVQETAKRMRALDEQP